jgi:hypothetical protein
MAEHDLNFAVTEFKQQSRLPIDFRRGFPRQPNRINYHRCFGKEASVGCPPRGLTIVRREIWLRPMRFCKCFTGIFGQY